MSDVSYRSYVIRIWVGAQPGGITRAEIEQVRSGIEVVVEGDAAERLAGAIEASLADARQASAREAKEMR